MTPKQKEISGYIIAGILIFAFWADSIYKPLTNSHSEEMEYKTGQHWVIIKDKK